MNKNFKNEKLLFRENALKGLNTIEEIHESLNVVNTKSIFYILVSVLTLVAIMIWGIYGSLEVEVLANGILLSAKQLQLAEKKYTENLQEQEMALYSLKKTLDKKELLFQKHYLTIDEIQQARQKYLEAKEKMNFVSKLNNHSDSHLLNAKFMDVNDALVALIFVSASEGKKIAAGMSALILPSTLSSYEYGYIKGHVMYVSDYPVSKEFVYAYLENMNLVDDYFRNGAPFVVKIALDSNAKTVTGLNWTTSSGAPFLVSAGGAVSTKIVSQHYFPYQLFIKYAAR